MTLGKSNNFFFSIKIKYYGTPLNTPSGKTLIRKLTESYCKEIQPVHPKGDQFWVFIGRTDAEAETSVLWPPYAKN